MRVLVPAVGFAFFFFLAVGANAGGERQIGDLEVGIDGSQTLISFKLEEAIDQEFLDRVDSGLPTGFIFKMEMIRIRKRWFDKRVRKNSLQVIAMYDALEQEYLVNYKLGGKLIESRMVDSRDDLRSAMTELEAVPAFTLEDVPAQWRLIVRTKAELGSKTILALIPAKVDTDWAESTEFHSPNPPR